MRPRGEIREALAGAGYELAGQAGGFTWRQAAERSQVGFEAARRTACNMAAAGEWVVVGTARVDTSRRPMVLYAPAERASDLTEASVELSNVVNSWASFV